MSCVCSSNATMLPQQFTTDATNTSLVLGPLFPGQSVMMSAMAPPRDDPYTKRGRCHQSRRVRISRIVFTSCMRTSMVRRGLDRASLVCSPLLWQGSACAPKALGYARLRWPLCVPYEDCVSSARTKEQSQRCMPGLFDELPVPLALQCGPLAATWC